MMDDLPVIHIGIETEALETSLALDRSLIAEAYTLDGYEFFIPAEAPDKRIMLSSDGAKGFVLTYGSEEECRALLSEFLANGEALMQSRKDRINSLVTEYNPIKSNLPELDKSMDWITITMDELITQQQGNGIYAGLPWFNEYWGRDMFISMPGACLVTGQFDIAKQILKETDNALRTYILFIPHLFSRIINIIANKYYQKSYKS